MEDPPAVAAEVVIEARQVRADRSEGLAGGEGAHGGAIVARQRVDLPPAERTRQQLAEINEDSYHGRLESPKIKTGTGTKAARPLWVGEPEP